MASKIPQRPKKAPPKAHPFFNKKSPTSVIDGKTPDEVKTLFQTRWDAGQYEQGKEIALAFTRIYPQVAQAWSDLAACCVHLQEWDNVIEYATQAYQRDPEILSAIDALAHAYGGKYDVSQVQYYGHIALVKRDERYGHKIFMPWDVVPPAPFSQDKTRNIIAFSLFGENPKYCESGILNVLDQPKLYPNWTCRFYVDDTVPTYIIERLKHHGAQVVMVDERLKKWPAPMWRFAAYDDVNVDRIIFRDADSVISEREVGAVCEWIDSGQPFHMMRDGGSHTELILAGLWGVTRAALPPMRDMVADYLKVTPESMHFADQYFLREYVWPYARHHIIQHDSLFDFMNPRPFPEGAHRTDFHCGCTDSSPKFEANVDKPNGTRVFWKLLDQSGTQEREVCRYETTVLDGKISVNLSRRYIQRINQDFIVIVEK